VHEVGVVLVHEVGVVLVHGVGGVSMLCECHTHTP